MELTADTIKRRSGHYDVGLVALLDISKMRIRRLANLEACTNLLELNLAHNELRSLEGLPSLPLLRCLHLTDNQLTSIENLPRLPLLEELLLADNQIDSIDFATLAAKLPSLRVLDFHNNPMDSSATALASRAFPELFILNGEALTLTRLLEEISADDFGDSSTHSDEDEASERPADDEYPDGKSEDEDDIGVNRFIEESTRQLQGLLLQCKQTLEKTNSEGIQLQTTI